MTQVPERCKSQPTNRPSRSTISWRATIALGVALFAVVALATACRVDLLVEIDVTEPSGAGTVQLTTSFDEATLEAVPDLESMLRLDDVRDAGWQVNFAPGGTASRPTGSLVVTASKAFVSAEHMAEVLAEIDGPDGLISHGEARITVDDTTVDYDLAVLVDARRSVYDLGGAMISDLLGGEAAALSPVELERRAGRPLDELVRVAVEARVPGSFSRLPADGWLSMADGGRHLLTVHGTQTFDDVVDAEAQARDAEATANSTRRWVRVWWAVLAGGLVASLMVLAVGATRVRKRQRAGGAEGQMRLRFERDRRGPRRPT